MKVMIFENDAEFEDFAINPQYVVKTSDKGTHYFTWDFTDMYKEEKEKGTIFCISDENSLIRKRQACTFGIISKPVDIDYRCNESEFKKE